MEAVLILLLYKNYKITIILHSILFLCLYSFTSVFAEQPGVETVELETKADSLYNEGKILWELYQYKEAIDKFKLALEIDRKLGRLKNVALELSSIGEIYYNLSQYDSVLAYCDSALVIARRINDRQVECATLKIIGAAYEGLCHYEKALVHCDTALFTARKIKDKKIEGRTLATIGIIYAATSDYDNALVYYDSALTISREAKDREGEANTLSSIGAAYDAIGEYDRALNYYRSALDINQRLKNLFGEASNLSIIGRAHHNLSRYDSAFTYYQSALLLSREIKDRRGESRMLNNIGLIYYNLGQYENALAYLDSALLIKEEIKDRRGMGITVYSIGIVYHALSKFDHAIAYYDSSLILMRKIGSGYTEGAALNNIGSSFYALGNYERALVYYDSALVIAREIKDRQTEAATLNNIGIIYHELAQYDRALAYYDSALVIKKEIKNRQSEGTTLQNMGDTYRALKQYNRALAYFDSALTIEREVKDLRGEAYNFDNIGVTYYALTQYDTSLAYLDSSLSINREIKDLRGEGTALSNIGCSYYALKQYERALAYYDSALVILREIKDRYGEGVTLDYIGQVYEDTEDVDNAVAYYKDAIKVKESIREELRREDLRTSYIETEKDMYERLIILLIMLERYEEAFDYLGRSHSEKLRKAFEEGGIVAFDPSLKRTLDRINFLEGEMAGLKKRYRDKEIEEALFEIKMNELEGKLNQKMLDLKIYHPQLYNIIVPQRRTLKYIQETMPDSTMFVEFVSIGDTYVVLLFTKDVFLVQSIAEPRDSIDSWVLQTLTLLRLRVDKEEVDKHCEELYKILIKPMENIIEEMPNIVVIPYGVLHYLPFHMLRRQNKSGEIEYFVEWKRISYLPSASFLTDLLSEKERAEKELLAFGNADGTLPSAEIEVDFIAQIFPKSCVYKTDSARKDRFIELCGEYRLIHLATHGILDADPRFSYIVLAPPRAGNLTVREILGLSGHFKLTSLVTLSACETAVEADPETAGMELVTLSNAFKVAGVPSTVASLWEIADRSTALLMKDFYKNLKSGRLDKLEALRQAQILMIGRGQYSHPYYWAPFILIGDWR